MPSPGFSQAPVPVPWRCSSRSTARLQAGGLCPTVSPRGGTRESCHVQKYQPCQHVRHDVPGRRAPDDQLVRALLAALEAHRGRMARRLLVQVLGEPEFRCRGILTEVQRLLNVDGYQVIAVDDISGTVALNRRLLNTQFQLFSIHVDR